MTERYDRTDMEIVKCNCGKVLRRKDWALHWVFCGYWCLDGVTEADRESLVASEKAYDNATE